MTTCVNSMSGLEPRKVWDAEMKHSQKIYRYTYPGMCALNIWARVVRKVDNAIHRINRYPADSVVCFVNTYPLISDLSGA